MNYSDILQYSNNMVPAEQAAKEAPATNSTGHLAVKPPTQLPVQQHKVDIKAQPSGDPKVVQKPLPAVHSQI